MRRMTQGLAPRELQSLFCDGAATGLTDKELLQRFATRRDRAGELAFATVVARHGPMVFNVCLRMLRNLADAEDAFQATFLVLVRKAGSIRLDRSLGPWLYGVSVRVAKRARKVAARRGLFEREDALAEGIVERGSCSDRDLRGAIDEALARLPANYRSAIVLCYLEGLTHEEAAQRLRCPVGTVRSRLARGRDLLRHRLERAGLGPAACGGEPTARLEMDPAQKVVAPVLIDTTARLAVRLAAGQPLAVVVPARLAELVAGVTRTMTISKLAVATSLLFITGLAAWGAAGLAAPARDRERAVVPARDPVPAPVRTPKASAAPSAPAPAATQTGPEPARPVAVALREVAAETDEPMKSYPYTIDPAKVYEYPELAIKFRDLTLKSGPVAVIPMECEPGITGLMVIGNGTFRFAVGGRNSKNAKAVEGHFRAAMLRFNPEDQPAIIALDQGNKVQDQGVCEMSRHMLRSVFGHCWHRGDQALIPTKGAISAVLYTKEHGDLLVSETGEEAVVHNFTSSRTLYERK